MNPNTVLTQVSLKYVHEHVLCKRMSFEEFKEKLVERMLDCNPNVADTDISAIRNAHKHSVIVEPNHLHLWKCVVPYVDVDMPTMVTFEVSSTGISYLSVLYKSLTHMPIIVIYYFDESGKFNHYIPVYGNAYNFISKTPYYVEHRRYSYPAQLANTVDAWPDMDEWLKQLPGLDVSRMEEQLHIINSRPYAFNGMHPTMYAMLVANNIDPVSISWRTFDKEYLGYDRDMVASQLDKTLCFVD